MKPGRSLERLVAFLEESLARNKDIKLASPAKIPDRVTGKLREHDVLIVLEERARELLIAIECRDRSRPVTVAQVESFSRKCEDTGIDRGVIVSSTGFWRTARKKAEFYRIQCLSLKEVASLDWLGLPHLLNIHSQIIHIELTIAVKDEVETSAIGRIFDEFGNEVPRDQLNMLIHHVTSPSIISIMKPGMVPIPFKIRVEGLYAEPENSNRRYKVLGFEGTAHYEVWEGARVPFKTLRYEDDSTGHHLSDIAIASVSEGEVSGTVLIALKREEGGRMVFLPDAEPASSD